jgi:hypothetical protein
MHSMWVSTSRSVGTQKQGKGNLVFLSPAGDMDSSSSIDH